jgi:hypothetical protein
MTEDSKKHRRELQREYARKNRKTPERKAYMRRYMHEYGKHYNRTPRQRDYKLKFHLKHGYGITPAEYLALLAEQDGHCATCPEVHNGGQRLSVDHDHETGQVRGLLCRRCNLAIGQAGDNAYRLLQLASYLLK